MAGTWQEEAKPGVEEGTVPQKVPKGKQHYREFPVYFGCLKGHLGPESSYP